MLDRKNQIERILQSFQATKHKLFTGTIILSARNQIPNSQWIVLRIIEQNEGIGVKELSRMLGISSSAATQLIDPLVKKGHLICEKSPEDRRALKMRLTDEAKELINVTKIQASQKAYSFFDVLTDEELQTFCELSIKVVKNIMEK
jgi:DNA-binding MarR family transcriptional regulator